MNARTEAVVVTAEAHGDAAAAPSERCRETASKARRAFREGSQSLISELSLSNFLIQIKWLAHLKKTLKFKIISNALVRTVRHRI